MRLISKGKMLKANNLKVNIMANPECHKTVISKQKVAS